MFTGPLLAGVGEWWLLGASGPSSPARFILEEAAQRIGTVGLGSGVSAWAYLISHHSLSEPQQLMSVLDHIPAVPSPVQSRTEHRAPITGCFVSTWHVTMEVTPITRVTASGEDGDA